jgi:L-amino acid N-acyltransferase YncA
MLEELFDDIYPKETELKDGKKVVIRPIGKSDFQPLFKFCRNIPINERLYLQQDISNPQIVKSWIEDIDYWSKFRVIAEYNEKFIGYASLQQNSYGWMRSIGKLRIIIAPKFRKLNVGKLLLDEIIYVARFTGLEKLELELVGVDSQQIKPFQKIGFELQATIKDHVKDFSGKVHDYLLFIYNLKVPDEEIGAL